MRCFQGDMHYLIPVFFPAQKAKKEIEGFGTNLRREGEREREKKSL